MSDLEIIEKCPESFILAVNDTINVLTGKWKMPIMASLTYGRKRFTEIQREVQKITPRMLSKELRDLEMNGMIKRIVRDTIPVTIEYEFTESGKSFEKVLYAMVEWGLEHRESILKGNRS